MGWPAGRLDVLVDVEGVTRVIAGLDPGEPGIVDAGGRLDAFLALVHQEVDAGAPSRGRVQFLPVVPCPPRDQGWHSGDPDRRHDDHVPIRDSDRGELVGGFGGVVRSPTRMADVLTAATERRLLVTAQIQEPAAEPRDQQFARQHADYLDGMIATLAWVLRIAGRYFRKFSKFRNDRWVFGDKDTGAYLPKPSWTDIVRHILVKSGASPDDPPWPGTERNAA
jgi:hypothetical protein